jgi:hypothetical protein
MPFLSSTVPQQDSSTHFDSPMLAEPRKGGKHDLADIKRYMLAAVNDLHSSQAERLMYKINGTRRAIDLWQLRSDIYQAISLQHGQAEAAQRINQLLPCFAQWVPTRQLTPI